MTVFFSYENLTWPEVVRLPRNTPLVIPLGEGYPLEQLADALGNPARCGILPLFPYGWRGSGVEAPATLLKPYLANLLKSLREDGFSMVFALTPQELGLDLGWSQLVLPHSSRLSPAASIPSAEHHDKVVLIPVGHTEQHGYHLPLSVDSVLVDAVCQGTAEAIPEQAVALPVFPYGVSTHRSAFQGTLNAGGRAFEDFWLAVIDTLVARGFDRFYLISGHGGNCSYLTNVIKSAGERHRNAFCATAWLYLSGPSGVEAIQKHRRSGRGGMGHAGELETSMMLHLLPNFVQMEKVVDEVDFISTPSYYMDWAEGGSLIANPPWEDDTATGAYGAGSLATAENGKIWLEAAIAEKIDHVGEIHEQHTRRLARRKTITGR